MKKLVVSLSLLLLFGQLALGQNTYKDGTSSPSADEVALIRNEIMSRTVNTTEITNIPIQVHIVRTSSGSGGANLDDLNKGIAVLNHYFINAGIRFFLVGEAPNYIDDDYLYEYQSAKEADLVTNAQSVTAINLYCVDLIDYLGGTEYVWGISRYPLDLARNNRIIIKNSEIADGYAILQQFGHYFGLMNTYGQRDGSQTDEYANGSNCSVAGDLICDTKADPFSYGSLPLESDFDGCEYTGNKTDFVGTTFDPPVDNFMSVYSTSCKSRFTQNQYTRMAQSLAERQEHLNYSLSALSPSVYAPSGLTARLQDDRIVLNWVDNATNEIGYIVERSEQSASSGFVAVKGGGVGPDVTTFTDETIKANNTYYYRIRPVNSTTNYSNVSAPIDVPLVYCKPTYKYDNCSTGSDMKITRVEVSEIGAAALIDNSTDCSSNSGTINNFTYYSSNSSPAVSATLTAGNIYNFYVSTNNFLQHVTVWIDFNRDGDFETDEIILQTEGMQKDTNDKEAEGVQIPTNVKNGATRMRVRSRNGSVESNVSDPCAEYSYGETEDYEINLIGGISDETPPNFDSGTPNISNEAITAFDINVVLNEPGTVYYIAVAKGTSSGVTSEQVKQGVASDWQPAIVSGTIEVEQAILQYSRTVSGLQTGANYDVYVVAEDDEAEPNLMLLPAKISANTIIPDAEFISDKNLIYVGQEIQFTDLSIGAGARWSWTFGDGDVSAVQNPTHTYSEPGKFTVSLKINDGSGYESKEKFIHVLPNREVPYLAADGGNFEVNQNDFGTEQLNGSIQLWQLGSPSGAIDELNSPHNAWKTILNANVPREENASALLTPNFDFSAGGKYTLSFFKSMENLSLNGPYAVQVHYTKDKGEHWTILGTYNSSEGTNWYNSNPATDISNEVVADGQGWLLSATNEQTTYDVSFLAGEESIGFRFVMYVDGSFGIASYKDGFMVDDFEIQYTPPTPDFTADRTSVFPGETISFSDLSVGALTWSWDFGDETYSNAQNPEHTFTAPGSYSIKLTINDSEGYQIIKSGYITVLEEPLVPYTADFEDHDYGWRSYLITGTGEQKWEWGNSEVGFFSSFPALQGENNWCTVLNADHGTHTRYALESPVFTLKNGRGQYVLEFQYRGFCGSNPQTGGDKAGMRLDYRVNGGSWHVLGDLQTSSDPNAIRDWYNTEEISGLSGYPGWYSATANPYNPTYDITDFTAYETVQFRFVFGASGYDGAGFQIDDFKITGNQIAVPGLWTGTENRNWNEPKNWDSRTLPNYTTDVRISRTENMPVISTEEKCKSIELSAGVELVLQEGASLEVAEDFTMKANRDLTSTFLDHGGIFHVDGEVSIDQVLLNEEWDLVALMTDNRKPIIGAAVMRRYNESNINVLWDYMNSNSELYKVLQGYSMQYPKSSFFSVDTTTFLHTAIEDQAINTGEISLPVEKLVADGGFNLIGNPYPAYVDWDNSEGWLKEKIDAPIWTFNGKLKSTNSSKPAPSYTYGVYNGIVGVNNGDNILEPGEGFFVMANGDGSITVNNKAKISSVNQIPNTVQPEDAVLQLRIQNSMFSDEIAIGFHSMAKAGLDSLDARKILADYQEVPNMFVNQGGNSSILDPKYRMAIAFCNLDTLETMDERIDFKIGLSVQSQGDFSIYAENLTWFATHGYYVYLYDNITRVYTNLIKDEKTDPFYAQGDDINRFVLTISTYDFTLETNKLRTGWSIWSEDGKVELRRNNNSVEECQINVYDMNGRLIFEQTSNRPQTEIPLPKNQVYLLRVINPEGVFSEKVFVR